MSATALPFLYRQTGLLCLIAFGALLVVAPLAYGGSTAGSLAAIDCLLVAATGLGFYARMGSREGLRIPLGPIIPVVVLAVIGLVACLNPSHVYVPETGELRPLSGAISWLPSTYDRSATLNSVIHLAILGAAFLLLVDICRDAAFRWRMLQVIALTGAVVAMIGIAQKLAGASSMLWSDRILYEHQRTFFAAFRYHGHAGAFLNLCWPASLALLIRSLSGARGKRRYLERALWANCLAFTVAGLLFNTSKFGHAILIPGLLLAAVLFRRQWLPLRQRIESPRRAAVVAILCGGMVIALLLPVAEKSIDNWSWEIANGGSLDGRLLSYRICLDMAAAVGPFGSGAGTFLYAFPYFATPYAGQSSGVWIHAHQDYLQAAIEWGWLGAAAWLLLFGGAVTRGLRLNVSGDVRGGALAGTVALTGILLLGAHAMIDFPLRIGSVQVYATIYLAMLWGMGKETGNREFMERNRQRRHRSRRHAEAPS